MNQFTESALWFIFQDENILLQSDATPHGIPRIINPNSLAIKISHQQYLGIYEGIHCFTAELEAQAVISQNFKPYPVRQCYELLNNHELFLLVTRAKELVWWDKSSQFCGHCGTKTSISPVERAKICPQCNHHHYPHVAPVIMARITRDDKLLLARSPHFTSGIYSVLAGFIEPGETAEEAAIREVREEVGIEIKNIAYFGSQPWPFPSNLMIGFTAEYASGDSANKSQRN